MVGVCNDIKYSSCELHHPKRVLESAVGRPWIDEVGGSQLMDLPESLNGHAVNYPPLLIIEIDKCMNGITKLVSDLSQQILFHLLSDGRQLFNP